MCEFCEPLTFTVRGSTLKAVRALRELEPVALSTLDRGVWWVSLRVVLGAFETSPILFSGAGSGQKLYGSSPKEISRLFHLRLANRRWPEAWTWLVMLGHYVFYALLNIVKTCDVSSTKGWKMTTIYAKCLLVHIWDYILHQSKSHKLLLLYIRATPPNMAIKLNPIWKNINYHPLPPIPFYSNRCRNKSNMCWNG